METKYLNDIQKEIYSKIIKYNVFPVDEAHLQVKIGEDGNTLIYKYITDNEIGFDVFIEIGIKTYSIYCENWHEIEMSFNTKEDVDVFLQKLIAFFNGSTKLIVKYSNNKPFYWELFHCDNKGWESLGKIKLLFFNYFGKRKEIYKINLLIKQ